MDGMRIRMKPYFFQACIFLFLSCLLISCTTPNPHVLSLTDLTCETWMHEINQQTDRWTNGASSWFLSGAPDEAEVANQHRSPFFTSKIIDRVPNFTNIFIEGNFKVELMGSDRNSIGIVGPRDAIGCVAIEMHGNNLRIIQMKEAPPSIRKVVVRICIRQLNKLYYFGNNTCEGVGLYSNQLVILSQGCGNIYLRGHLNLRAIKHLGSGCVNIFNATSSCLDILTTGIGAVNVCGQIAIHSIVHHGLVNINIIGACPTTITFIEADGAGKIGIAGTVNLRRLMAFGATRVYIEKVRSLRANITANDCATVGISGDITILYVTTCKTSRFLGRHLCAFDAYVKAYDGSHVNIAAKNKVFALATGNASIYFYGAPYKLTRFSKGNGEIVAVNDIGGANCLCPLG